MRAMCCIVVAGALWVRPASGALSYIGPNLCFFAGELPIPSSILPGGGSAEIGLFVYSPPPPPPRRRTHRPLW